MLRKADTGIQKRNILRLFIITISLLSIPFMAMIFGWPVLDPGSSSTERVKWDYFDFIVMGALIFSTGLVYEFLKLKINSTVHRIILAAVLFMVFCMIWAELAVGIFGTPFAGS